MYFLPLYIFSVTVAISVAAIVGAEQLNVQKLASQAMLTRLQSRAAECTALQRQLKGALADPHAAADPEAAAVVRAAAAHLAGAVRRLQHESAAAPHRGGRQAQRRREEPPQRHNRDSQHVTREHAEAPAAVVPAEAD